jgi:hypothetical protein
MCQVQLDHVRLVLLGYDEFRLGYVPLKYMPSVRNVVLIIDFIFLLPYIIDTCIPDSILQVLSS